MKRSLSLNTMQPTKHPDLQDIPSEAETGSELRRSKRVRCAADKVRDIEDVVLGPGAHNEYISTRPRSSKSATKNKEAPHEPKLKGVRRPRVPHPAPARWRETYDMVANMRSRETADVDTMGCQLAQEEETNPVVSNDPIYNLSASYVMW
jgi:endonuclease III